MYGNNLCPQDEYDIDFAVMYIGKEYEAEQQRKLENS